MTTAGDWIATSSAIVDRLMKIGIPGPLAKNLATSILAAMEATTNEAIDDATGIMQSLTGKAIAEERAAISRQMAAVDEHMNLYGDEDGGVTLECRACPEKPDIAYHGHDPAAGLINAATIGELVRAAVDHVTAQHPTT